MTASEQEIIEDLRANYPRIKSTVFSKKYDVEWLYIRKLIKRLKLGNPRKETIEEIKPKLIKEYRDSGNKIPLLDLAAKYRVGTKMIAKFFDEEGIAKRKTEEWSTKYKCNEDYFSALDSPEKAYWLGFIAADGYLSRKKLGISLQIGDIGHLELLRTALDSDFKIYFFRQAAMLWVSREKIYEDLKKLGIHERKTYTLDGSIFDSVPKKYMLAFCHGFFDGDGCFGVNFKKLKEGKGYSLNLALAGNKPVLERFKKEILELTGVDLSNIYRAKHTRQGHIISKSLGLETAKKIYEAFYLSENSSKHFLQRKKERIENKIKFHAEIQPKVSDDRL